MAPLGKQEGIKKNKEHTESMELFKTITRKIEGIITYASEIRVNGATTIAIAKLAASVKTDVADLQAITSRQEGMLEEARRVYELTIGHHTLMLPPALTECIQNNIGRPKGISDTREAPTPAPRRSAINPGNEPAIVQNCQRTDESSGPSKVLIQAPSLDVAVYSSEDRETDHDTDPDQQLALTRRSSIHSNTTEELEDSAPHEENSIVDDNTTSPVAGPSTLRVDTGDRLIITGCMRAASSSFAVPSIGDGYTHHQCVPKTPRTTSSVGDVTPMTAVLKADTIPKSKQKERENIYRRDNTLTPNKNRYVYLFDVPTQYRREDLASIALGSIGTEGFFRRTGK